MPVSVSHVLVATTPDDPAYEIRPSHWNSSHAVLLNAVGSEISGAFSNENNVSFGTNAGGFITASANVTAAPSPVNVTGANGSSVAAQTIAFSNANGISLGVSTAAAGATITGSYTVPSVPTAYVSSVNGSSGAISLNVGSSLSASTNGSSITFGLASNITTALQSAGAYLTTAALSNHSHGASAINGSFAFQTLSFSNANGVSFGTSAGSAITASHNAITTGRASTDAIGLNTAQTNVTWTVNSSGLSLNAGGYAGTTTGFAGANISGSMTHNTLGLSLSLSVAAPGAAAENNAINLLGANTAGNTTATGSTIGWSGINLTLSGTNNSIVNISAPATSSLVGSSGLSISTNGSTITAYQVPRSYWPDDALLQGSMQTAQIGNGTACLWPFKLQMPLVVDRALMFLSASISSSSNSSHAGSLSMALGIYTKNASSLSVSVTGSGSYAWTNSSNNSTVSLTGIRGVSFSIAASLSPGDYWLGFWSRTSTVNANWITLTNLVRSQMSTVYSGMFATASNASDQMALGYGVFSASSSTLNNSYAFSDVRGSAGAARNYPVMVLGNYTV